MILTLATDLYREVPRQRTKKRREGIDVAKEAARMDFQEAVSATFGKQ
jgi:hypothetical protein